MLVKHLIECLQEMPQELEVLIMDDRTVGQAVLEQSGSYIRVVLR